MKVPSLIRKYSVLVYAVFLVLSVTGAVFWNSYSTLRRFEDTTDKLLLGKAGLAEGVFGALATDLLDDPATLREKITALRDGEPDITSIVVYERLPGGDGFRTIASTDPEDADTVRTEFPYMLAWAEEDGAAFSTEEEGIRSWNVLKRIGDEGLVFFRFSLAENEAFVRRAIVRSYAVTIGTLAIVILLLLQHLRFSKYALRSADLEEVNRMKDDFISMASHELRNPLSVIRGYADLLGDDPSPEERRDYVGKISRTTEGMSELVDDLLDVSRLEQGRFPIRTVDMDIRSVLATLVDDYRKSAKEKGLDLVFHDAEVPRVSADPDRARQVLSNLLSNAVKYTEKGSVTVSVAEDGERVIVTVADTGYGISSEAMTDLFSKFYRVKTERTSEIRGTGLGLWISREIARRMGGELGAESIEGVGSHFRLYLRKTDS